MPIYAIWESRFPAPRAAAGRAVTEAIWRDMTSCEGYVNHELLVDIDDPGHLLVVSRWATPPLRSSWLRSMKLADHLRPWVTLLSPWPAPFVPRLSQPPPGYRAPPSNFAARSAPLPSRQGFKNSIALSPASQRISPRSSAGRCHPMGQSTHYASDTSPSPQSP